MNKSLLMEKIKNIDIFGQGIHLLINKQVTAKTTIGGLLSIVLLIGSTIIFLFMSIDIFLKEQPNVSIENEILTSRPNITLDKYSLPIAFSVDDGYGKYFIDPKYFYIEIEDVIIYTVNNQTIWTQVFYPIQICNPNNFPTFSNQSFYSIGLQKYYCIKDQNLSVGGYFDEKYVRYIGVSLRTCKNSTESETICAPEREIEEFFTNTTYYFTIYYQNTIFNTQSFKNFINPFIASTYKAIKYGILKNTELFFKKQNLISDNGFLINFFQQSEILTYDTFNYDIGDMDDSGYLCSYLIYSSNRHEIFRRNYLKFQYALAQTGALAEVFIRIFGIICFSFTKTALNKHILNKIYDFDLIKKDIHINTKQKEKNVSLRSMTLHQFFNLNHENSENNNTGKVLDNNYLQNSNYKNELNKHAEKSLAINDKNKDIIDQSNILYIIRNENEKNNLKFSYLEIIKLYWCCGIPDSIKEKKNLYEKSLSSLEDYLDISNIILKLEEFEKMKLLLLSFDQLAVFNYISKDLCTLNEWKQEESTINKFKEFNKDMVKLSETILKFRKKISENSDNLTELDKKLYDLLRTDLKN